MTEAGTVWWRWVPLVWMIPGAMMILTVGIVWSIPGNWSQRRALCDHAVEALLHSTELVEVERAGIIIRRLDCSIGSRL